MYIFEYLHNIYVLNFICKNIPSHKTISFGKTYYIINIIILNKFLTNTIKKR